VLNICFLLEYVYLAHGSCSNIGHGWISIVLSSLRIHMFGCAQILQNDVISLLILYFLSLSSIIIALILSIDLRRFKFATFKEWVKFVLNCFSIDSGGQGK
jgi:hypothetical protein